MPVIYSQPGCFPCVATKRKFDSLGIAYQEVNISESPEAVEHIRTLGYKGTPVVFVDDSSHWYGYKPDAIAALC